MTDTEDMGQAPWAGPPGPHFWAIFSSSRKCVYLHHWDPWLTPWYFSFSGNIICSHHLGLNHQEKKIIGNSENPYTHTGQHSGMIVSSFIFSRCVVSEHKPVFYRSARFSALLRTFTHWDSIAETNKIPPIFFLQPALPLPCILLDNNSLAGGNTSIPLFIYLPSLK